jgi:chlorophyllide a reductase subunit Z
MRNLVNADVNICMYREFGRGLCEVLGKPYLQAPIGVESTTKFLRTLGELTGLDPEPFIETGKAFDDQAGLGPLAIRHAGFLRHGKLRHRRERDLCARRPQLPRNRSRPALRLRGRTGRRAQDRQRRGPRHGQRKASADPDGVDQREDVPCRDGRGPWAEAGLHSGKLPRRRDPARTGTPFMGYAGATYILLQEVCNGLFDALFHILPLGSDMDSVARQRQRRCAGISHGTRTRRLCSTASWPNTRF